MARLQRLELARGAEVVEDPAVLTEAGPPEGAPTPRAALGAAAASGAKAPSRRAVLAASAAALPLLLTACKGVQALGTPPPPAPDIVALRAAISAEAIMVARYDAALGPFEAVPQPRVTPRDVIIIKAMKAVRAEHAGHLAQLKSRLIQPPGSAPTSRPSPGQSAAAAPTGGLAAEIAPLADAEQAASDRLIGQLAGLPPSLAQLFASIAASEATHVPYLQAARPVR